MYILDTIFDDVPDEYASNFLMPNRYPMPLEDYDYRTENLSTFPGTLKFPSLSTLTGLNYDKACEEGDVTGLFGYAGAKLIMEDGRCAGVYAEDLTNGGYVKVNANKGVVLCCGDYKDNPEMISAFTPQIDTNGNTILSLLSDVNGNKACTGDGHKMSAWAGARLQDNHAVMIHHMGGGAGPDGRGVMGMNGYLQLNLDGERFMNEDLPGQQLENQVEKLRERTSYQFFDSAWPEQCKYFPQGHGVVLYCLEDDAPPKNHNTNTNWRCPRTSRTPSTPAAATRPAPSRSCSPRSPTSTRRPRRPPSSATTSCAPPATARATASPCSTPSPRPAAPWAWPCSTATSPARTAPTRRNRGCRPWHPKLSELVMKPRDEQHAFIADDVAAEYGETR